MKKGDLIKFKGSWADGRPGPRFGIVLAIMYNGITRSPANADIAWSDGTHGNIMTCMLEVVSEGR